MAQYYREALERKGGDDVYAFNNWAVACLLLRRLDPSAPPATGCRRWPR